MNGEIAGVVNGATLLWAGVFGAWFVLLRRWHRSRQRQIDRERSAAINRQTQADAVHGVVVAIRRADARPRNRAS